MKSFAAAFLAVISCTVIAVAGEWTENSFVDFNRGLFLDAGSNLYVSAAGRMQIVNRWDLNNDGFLDIVMPSGHAHTEKEDTYIYLNNGQDIDGRSLIHLPANGSRDGLVFDFNKDGLNDLAVCNGDNGITTWTDAYIYYGSKDGLKVANRITLPARNSTSIAAGDFNGDGWTDLAIACQWQAGDIHTPPGPKCSFIYWNGPKGFDPEKRTPFDLDGVGATAVAAGDLDGDGIDDLVMMFGNKTLVCYSKDRGIENKSRRVEIPFVAKSGTIGDVNGDKVQDLVLCTERDVVVVPGSAGGLAADRAIHLEALSPRKTAIADFDGDGMNDIAIANHSTPEGATWINSYVYWADGKDFKTRPRTELPSIGASSISAGDLNGDGRPEIVISNEGILNQHNLPSCVFWNEGGRFRGQNRTELETQGPVGNAIGDINNDGRPDVVFFNFEGNFRDGPSSSQIYWGDGTRNYSSLRSLEIPTHYITSIAHADLNDDGYVDLILTQSRFINETREDLFNSVIILWGSERGFTTHTRLTVDNLAGGVRVVDLNKDGWLDLVVGGVCEDAQDPKIRGIPIFWGSKLGFSQKDKTILTPAAAYPRAPLIADLNRDGLLDLVNQTTYGTVTIWWGKGLGTFRDDTTTIDLGRKDELVFINAADLNKDGWLDLILPNRKLGEEKETSSFVYYGSPNGFSKNRREELPSTGIYETSAADLDRDGWLDLVFTSYQGNFKRNFPSYIYWGSADGFLKRKRTELPTYAASGVETADYDGDGYIDILFSNHRIDGSTDKPGPHNHKTNSMLYWGGKDGFSTDRRWDFPCNGPHAMNIRDVGNSYDRGLYEDYISAPHQLPEHEHPRAIRWIADTPHGTSVSFQLRASDDPEALKSTPWRGPDGETSWYTKVGALVGPMQGRWIQDGARLSTPNGGPTPYLTSVTIRSDTRNQ